jgi:hypothetical protein
MHYLAFSGREEVGLFVGMIREKYPTLLLTRDNRGDRPADLATSHVQKQLLEVKSDHGFQSYRWVLNAARTVLFVNVVSAYLLLAAVVGYPLDQMMTWSY